MGRARADLAPGAGRRRLTLDTKNDERFFCQVTQTLDLELGLCDARFRANALFVCVSFQFTSFSDYLYRMIDLLTHTKKSHPLPQKTLFHVALVGNRWATLCRGCLSSRVSTALTFLVSKKDFIPTKRSQRTSKRFRTCAIQT